MHPEAGARSVSRPKAYRESSRACGQAPDEEEMSEQP